MQGGEAVEHLRLWIENAYSGKDWTKWYPRIWFLHRVNFFLIIWSYQETLTSILFVEVLTKGSMVFNFKNHPT